MDEITAKSERNLGLDALKLFSMFLIALLHVLGQGGVLGACPFGSARGEAAWFWETLGYCSVDCFALATGYIMAGRQVHYKRLFGLWLTVVFWMLAATAVFALAQPGTVGLNDWLVCLFPAVTKQYWYFTCYFGLFFFMPFLNKLLANLTQAGCKRLFWTLAALLSLLPCLLVFRVFLPALPHPDVFVANGGYSLLWLAALYLLGGCCKKCHTALQYRRRTLGAVFLASILLSWLSRLGLGLLTQKLYGETMEETFFISYTAPGILLASLCLLLLAVRTRPKKIAAAFIRRASPLAFGVYIIHTQPLVWARVMKGAFVWLARRPAPLLFVLAPLSALGVFLCCLLLDGARELLFRLLRVGRLCERAAAPLQKKADEAGISG